MSKIYSKIKGLKKANKAPEVQETQRTYYEDTHRTYSCIHCRTQLASHEELISKLFQGNHGRAYLFNKVINISCKQAVKRQLLTGPHAVADIYCDKCETILGWKYEQAFVPSQKYKEGKYIIELVHMYKENEWDISSYNARDVIKEINQSNRQKYNINDFKIGENYFGSVVSDLNRNLACPLGNKQRAIILAAKQHFQEPQQQQQDIKVKSLVGAKESDCITNITTLGDNHQEATQPTDTTDVNGQTDKTPDSQPGAALTKTQAGATTTFVGLRCPSLASKKTVVGDQGQVSDGTITTSPDSGSGVLDSIKISLNGLHSFDTGDQQPSGNPRQCILISNSAIVSS